MTFDVRTAALVGLAVAAPSMLESANAHGISVPHYVTGGQLAALAAFGGQATGTTDFDTQQFQSLLFAGTGKMPTLTGSQAADLAQRLLAACDAGAAATTEPYAMQEPVDGFAGFWNSWGAAAQQTAAPRSALGKAYDDVKSMSLFTPDDSDAADLSRALNTLANEMDNQGFLVTGKPTTVTLAGGFAAAGKASAAFIENVTAGAVGAAASAAFDLLMTSPVLVGIAGLIAWRVLR